MPGPAILLKLAGTPGQGLAGLSLGAVGPRLTLKPLFSLDGGAAAQGLAPTRPQTWFRAETADPAALASPADAWDAAHAALREGLGVGGVEVLAAEPDIEQGWPAPRRETALAAADPNQPAGQKGAPFDVGNGFGWHLDDQHSGLAAARTIVGPTGNKVTIAHLDTGYDPTHLALPANLDKARQRNFVETATPNSAVDTIPASGPLTNRGHGTGTIGILAGGSTVGLRSALAIPATFGPLGGAPEAQVVPVRVANSVVHFWTSTVAQGIDYARQIGADVLSMSMGGLPAQSWADAVNAAYEAGVVLVCAAGNSFNGLPTSLIVYPARFDRVIAACGVMAQGNPYYGLDGNVMEGCAGPASKMATAMAAYTPNIHVAEARVPRRRRHGRGRHLVRDAADRGRGRALARAARRQVSALVAAGGGGPRRPVRLRRAWRQKRRRSPPAVRPRTAARPGRAQSRSGPRKPAPDLAGQRLLRLPPPAVQHLWRHRGRPAPAGDAPARDRAARADDSGGDRGGARPRPARPGRRGGATSDARGDPRRRRALRGAPCPPAELPRPPRHAGSARSAGTAEH